MFRNYASIGLFDLVKLNERKAVITKSNFFSMSTGHILTR